MSSGVGPITFFPGSPGGPKVTRCQLFDPHSEEEGKEEKEKGKGRSNKGRKQFKAGMTKVAIPV